MPQDPVNKVPEQIRICKMVKNEIYEFIQQLNHNKYTVHYPQLLAQNENILGELKKEGSSGPYKHIQSISFTQKIAFDENLRYLVCYGGVKMMILNIE